jgi:hypothetical protein
MTRVNKRFIEIIYIIITKKALYRQDVFREKIPSQKIEGITLNLMKKTET